MIVLTATAMGLRNAVVRKLAVPDLTTTVLTLTVTGLAADSGLAGVRLRAAVDGCCQFSRWAVERWSARCWCGRSECGSRSPPPRAWSLGFGLYLYLSERSRSARIAHVTHADRSAHWAPCQHWHIGALRNWRTAHSSICEALK